MFLPRFEVHRGLLEYTYTHTEKWNLYMFYTFFLQSLTRDVICVSILKSQTRLDQSKHEAYTVHCIIAD